MNLKNDQAFLKCIFKWLMRGDLCVKAYVQWAHLKGLSLLWGLVNGYWDCSCVQTFSNTQYIYRVSPQYVCLNAEWEHIFLRSIVHTLPRVKGLSPVCVLKWVIRRDFRKKLCSHWSQVKGLSPVCVLKWVVRLDLSEKRRSHWPQVKGLSPVCVLKCLVR